MSTTYKPSYAATATAFTISPQNVATSATFVAGVDSDIVSNISNLYSEILISGKWTCGTTPTINTICQVYLYCPITDDLASTIVYADVMDGTGSAETFTSAGVMSGSIYFLGALSVDATTSDRTYWFRQTPVRAIIGFVPTRFGLYISHNSGVNTNTTAGNHAWWWTGVNDQSV